LERRPGLMRGLVPAPRAQGRSRPLPRLLRGTSSRTLMLDGESTRYLETPGTRARKTVQGYTHTMGQFFKSCGNKLLRPSRSRN